MSNNLSKLTALRGAGVYMEKATAFFDAETAANLRPLLDCMIRTAIAGV